MADIFDWSTTAGSNGTVDGINIAEGCPAGNLNNAARSIMALVRNSFASALESFLAGSAGLPVANGGTAATSAADARTNLGLGTVAVESTVPVAKGGTGAITAALAFAAIVEESSSIGANGYIKFRSGLMFQWGNATSSGTPGAAAPISFPAAFPTSLYAVLATPSVVSAATSSAWTDSGSASGYNLRCNVASIGCYWFAAGA